MRRGKPLRRKTPLRQAAPKRSRRGTGPARDVVDSVYERAAWACELCAVRLGSARGIDHHIHHRRPRAMGGTDRPDTNLPSNLLLLCPPCHEDVESRRGDALRCGLLLSQACDPAATAVRLAGPRWVYLTASGRYSNHPSKERR